MKKGIKIVILLQCLMLLTGCWDRKELSDIKVVSGIAVDKGEKKKYKVTVEALNAAELSTRTSSGNAAATVESIEGDTFAEITYQFNEYYAQLLIYSHMKLLVISEEIARAGMLDFIDYVERNRELRDDFKIIIAKGSKAGDILKITTHYRKTSSLKLAPQLEMLHTDWGGDPGVRINDFISELTLEGKSPVLATVRLRGSVEKGKSVENITKLTPDAIVLVDSLAVFKGKKLIGFLTIDDARNYLWTQNKLTQTSFSIECKGGDYSSIRLTQSKTEVTSKWKDGKPYIKIDIDAEGYIEGTQCNKNLDEVKTIEEYEKSINKSLAHTIENTIGKAQTEFKTDIFGFGEVMRRQDYHAFMKVKDKWNEEFSNAKVDVNVDFIIRRAGIRSKSFLNE